MLFANGNVTNHMLFLVELFAGILMHECRIHLLTQSVTLVFFYLGTFFLRLSCTIFSHSSVSL